MEEKHLTTEEAARVGCIIFLSIFAIVLLLLGWFFSIFYVFIAIPIIMIGGLIGGYFTRTQDGAWFGAWIGMLLGIWLTWSIYLKFTPSAESGNILGFLQER